MHKNLHKATDCIHSDTKFQGVNTPIYTSTANRYLDYDETIYPRYFNTGNQKIITEKLARLEKGEDAIVFSSGMAAISTSILSQIKSGDHVIVSTEIYGGTHKFILDEFKRFGIEFNFVFGNDLEKLKTSVKPNTRIIYTETPSNPLLSIIDLEAFATFAKSRNIVTIVDNTFGTPINQNPLELGIDIVIHSGTKYLSGHSDLCFGAMVSSKSIKEKVLSSALNFGGSLNALDCYLIERSLKTLEVRVTRQNDNAMELAHYLKKNKKVRKVYYPGLEDHPEHEVAKKQMNEKYGGMLSFELQGVPTEQFLKKLHLIAPAVSLGGVETIICQPSKTSHVKMSPKDRLKIGVTDDLLRLSVGIENTNDLINDIEQALT